MNNELYSALIERNKGLITEEQQEVLKNTTVALFGLGGLGGVIGEILVRSGICSLKIIDYDKFDASNLNRQIFAFTDTIGKWKTDVTEEYLKKINPDIKIEKYTEVAESNIATILKGAEVAVLALDSVEPFILISREARKMKIPCVEGWALPFGNVRVFTQDTPTLEEVYGLPTQGKDLSSISEEEYADLKKYTLATLKNIEGVEAYYPPFAVQRIMEGKIPSFAPMVWFTAVLMAMETLKVILNWGTLSLAPKYSVYDPFANNIPKQGEPE